MTRQIFLILLSIFLFACKKDHTQDAAIINEIVNQIDAASADLNYSFEAGVDVDKKELVDNKSVIRLKIFDCKSLFPDGKNKRAIASFAATKLMTGLSPETLEDSPGILIAFNNTKDTTSEYFSKKELVSANTAYESISKYIHFLSSNDTIKASTFVSNSHFDFSVSEFNKAVKARIKSAPTKIICMHDIIDSKDKNGGSCKIYWVLTVIMYPDNSLTKIDFAVPENTPTKIVTLHFRD